MKLHEILLGAAVVYFWMKSAQPVPPPAEAEVEELPEEEEAEQFPTVPPGFVTGIGQYPAGVPSAPPGPTEEELEYIRQIDP